MYPAANPGWIDKPFFLSPWTRTSLLNTMRTHINTMVGHLKSQFPGVVTEWDVVNEPFVGSGGRHNSWRSAPQTSTLFTSNFTKKRAYDLVRCRLNDPKPLSGP